MITSLPHIAAMAPYALAGLPAANGSSLISLSQNESLRPPSPMAITAATQALQASALYPDPDWHDLRHGLAALHGLDPDSILCGNGSLDLIGCLARAYAGPGRAVLAPAHAYPFFRTAAQMAAARYDSAGEQDLTVSVDLLLAAIRADTKIVFVANPGNPTGTRISAVELRRLRNGLPDDILLVIDEAYGEFADPLGERVFDLVDRGATVVLRTFSKAYGLAGLRVGWGVFPPDIAANLRKVMNPNAVARPSQVAAVAALSDQAYMLETVALTAELRTLATTRLGELGLPVRPSFTNFVLIQMKDETAANRAGTELCRAGIFLRAQTAAGLTECLRMTIGPKTALTSVLAVLERLKLAGQI